MKRATIVHIFAVLTVDRGVVSFLMSELLSLAVPIDRIKLCWRIRGQLGKHKKGKKGVVKWD